MGWELDGDATRTCEEGGSWSGSAPSCTPVDCGALMAPTNGDVAAMATTFGSIATYFCNDGFDLVGGDSSRSCQADGTWSGNAPMCVPDVVDCGAPPSVTGGRVSAPDTTVGNFAVYTCGRGRQMYGSDRLYCGADGNWLGEPPLCMAALSCMCGGRYYEGEPVEAVTDIDAGRDLVTGTTGTIEAGNTSAGFEVLVDWNDWTNGHTGNCGASDCGTCETSPIRNRWYVACDDVASRRLPCACGARFATGDRVVALVDGPSSARGVTRGRQGTVIAGNDGGDLQVLIQWDRWTSGHDGNCGVADCGTCTASATNNRWWTACDQIGNAP